MVIKEIKEYLKYKLDTMRQPQIDMNALKERLDVSKWCCEEGYNVQTTIPQRREQEYKNIVVGLLHCEETSYNMICSLYEAFNKDEFCRPIVVLQGKGYKNQYQELRKQMEEHAIQWEYDFDCTEINFDILIVHHVQLPPTRDVEKIINHATLKAAVPVGVINYDGKGVQANNIKRYQATEVFIEQSIYDLTPDSVKHQFHCFATGNPKFDCIYQAWRHNVRIPEPFQKLKNPKIKKIILWTTDHVGNGAVCSPEVAFDLYANTIFGYVGEHKEIGLIFRPYRIYVEDLLLHGLWSEEKVNCFKEYCRKSDNLVWDDEPDYSASYSLADAILADAGCGIICSALPMMKPIGITLRYDMDIKGILSVNQEICDNHYLISSDEDIWSFFEMVNAGKDPNYEKRKELCAKYVTNFDGKNGERIKNILMQKLRK